MTTAGRTLDLKALDAYLSAHLPGYTGPSEARKFSDGQSNPTFLLKASSGDYVLRCKPLGKLLKSAHAVDREFRVQKALQGTDVPVARMHLLCEDDSVIGSAFYVMDHIQGRIFFDPRLSELDKSERLHFFNEMNRVLAALHAVDFDAVGLSDYGPPGNYFARQTARWSKQYRASETDPIPDMDRLIDLLTERMPEDDGRRSLVHGDYRIDNLIFSPDAPRISAVLDWELSTIGHPFADLASVIMQWQMPTGSDGRGLAGVDRRSEGLPEDEEFVASYCDRMGISKIDDFGFCLAFCFFRMAAVLQGVKKRALDGNASNPDRGLRLGAYIPEFAAQGLQALNR